MSAPPADPLSLAVLVIGAAVAGFVTGLAGFGTGLVASGFWFHALAAPMVPPLVTLTSVAGQLVGLVAVRKAFDWRRAIPYLAGGLIGVPFGLLALEAVSPDALRFSMGVFLVLYAASQLAGLSRLRLRRESSAVLDGTIGAGGGFMGGFAGLSGPLPLIWLQLQGGPADGQRAVYQPFNMLVLTAAGAGMALTGQMDRGVLLTAAICLPATVVGAIVGSRVYVGVDERRFRQVVLALLLVSGLMLVAKELF
ncbi:MAG: sulfite exporter TauE/SafE family protein [Geminicoccaceae bacterium]|nr:sulfite exporter TauE/SafE family protein [Geminicoccaceae bacterium]